MAAYNDLFSGLLLSPFAGSWMYHVWLRMMGARLGQDVFVVRIARGAKVYMSLALHSQTI